LVVPDAEVDLAAGQLWNFAPAAVSETPVDPGHTALLAGFDDLATAAMVADAMPAAWSPSVEVLDDDAGLDAWRAFAAPVGVGGVLLWPAWWDTEPPAGEELVVRLDPGHAFGSGSHVSTRQALDLLQRALRTGMRVLDLGGDVVERGGQRGRRDGGVPFAGR
jgi:ribosomal protein L11 methylase PrmA